MLPGVVVAAALGGAVVGAVYSPRDGLLTGLYLLALGTLALAAVQLLLRRRRTSGSLAHQLAVGVAASIGLTTLGVGAIGLLMFISPHDALVMTVLLLFAGALSACSVWVLTRETVEDVRTVRDGLRAVGEGERELKIRTGASDELAELASAANRMVAKLAESEAERDMAEQARRDLVAAVSHDLRTPLTSLRLLSAAIEDDLVDRETRRGYVEQMSLHLCSLSALIDDLFELSRIEAGDISWSMQKVGLAELVSETVEAMRAEASARHVVVTADLDGIAVSARGNPERLQRVLFNLIQNALRHTPADGSVTVAAEANGSSVEVEVADTGPGIAPDEQARVFEPFYRGGGAEARSGGSTGLGLTICRAIVEAHGGRIWLAESATGARVRFSLPKG